MRKLGVFVLGAALAFTATFCVGGNVTAKAAETEKTVYVGGMSAGFTLKTGGAQIIGMSEVMTESGAFSPAMKAGLRAGDIIYKVSGIPVESIADLNEIVNKSSFSYFY